MLTGGNLGLADKVLKMPLETVYEWMEIMRKQNLENEKEVYRIKRKKPCITRIKNAILKCNSQVYQF